MYASSVGAGQPGTLDAARNATRGTAWLRRW